MAEQRSQSALNAERRLTPALVVWLLAGSTVDPDRVVAVLDGVESTPGVVIPLAALLPGLGAGPALLALAVYREHLASRATALLLAVGAPRRHPQLPNSRPAAADGGVPAGGLRQDRAPAGP